LRTTAKVRSYFQIIVLKNLSHDTAINFSEVLTFGSEKERERRSVRLILYISRNQYYVPESFTIIQAYEYSGHQYTRMGCRGGRAGHAAMFMIPGSPQIKTGLACQTQVVSGMSIIHIHISLLKARL
jgi:hypothetical protein